MRRVAGVFDDTSYTTAYLNELADTAAAYVERKAGHVLTNKSVVDYYPYWPHHRRYGVWDDDYDWERDRRNVLRLSAASPYRAPLTQASYSNLTLDYWSEDAAWTNLAPPAYSFDETTHPPGVYLADSTVALEFGQEVENPIRASYTYIAPALAEGVKEAVSFVFQQIFLKQNTGEAWATDSLDSSVSEMLRGLFGGAEGAQVF